MHGTAENLDVFWHPERPDMMVPGMALGLKVGQNFTTPVDLPVI